MRFHPTFIPPPLLGLLLAVGLGACAGGLSSTNVGEPSGQMQRQFRARLAQVRPGMPADSLDILFAEVEKAGQVGILHRSRLAVADLERVTYTLGWKSDPRHQIGSKELEDVDVALALAVVEHGRVVRVERLPEAR